MNNGRWYPTNTTLPNGDVLVISGTITSGAPNVEPQVWQSATSILAQPEHGASGSALLSIHVCCA